MIPNLAITDGPSIPGPQRSLFVSLSLTLHAVLILIAAIALGRHAPDSGTVARHLTADKLIWMGREELSGDSARSVNRSSAPARRIADSAPNRPLSADRIPPEIHHDPILALVVPALPETAGLHKLPGTETALTATDVGSLEAGADERGGSGRLGAVGTGQGRKGGDGGGDSGSGPGGDVNPPELLQQVRPGYTADALHARAQGTVVVDAVVNADGSVGDVRIVRSFTPTFGLDNEAIRAVKQWRFRPGSRRGRVVPALVTIELTFSLR